MSKQVDGMRIELGEWWGRIGLGRRGLGGVGRYVCRYVGPGQEIASILSIGIKAFFAIFSGTLTS